jgi:hypothetical protein
MLRLKLMEITPYGYTSLGPALVASITLAGCNKGSTVLICTDGEANVGVGGINSPDAQTFY